MGFTHLHVHTEFSLLDGASRIDRLVSRAKELKMTSLAITDHGVMFGVVDFYKECKKQGIKPIIGCEVYTAKRKYTDKIADLDKNQGHLILLVKNETGYKNLIKIVSEGFIKGYYYKPRIDKDVLRAHSEGLICLSACLAGEVQNRMLKGDYTGAKEEAEELLEIFGEGNFYLEIQDQGLNEEMEILPNMKKLSKEIGVPLVATNDVHYVYKEDAKAHDVLLAIQTATTLDDDKRMKFPNDEFYLKSEDEMKKIFSYAPEAVANTEIIADMCDFDFKFGEYHLPEFRAPDNKTNSQYLRELCARGLEERYGKEKIQSDKTLEERLNYEIETIETMGYIEYFLIVWDFINFAKKNNIMVGPGRGSAAGSLVAYTLKITDIDPIKYNLIFERFLNPERISMPDIDIDFCYERRPEVIEYVANKYGADRVSQIITFGTMKAKQAVRDVGRALSVPYAKADQIAKAIPFDLKMTLDLALKTNPDFKKLYAEDSEAREVIDMAKAIEGLTRHASTHAAGVVISKKPIDEYVPLYLSDKGPATQFNMTTIEELGLLKMDFLGLRNLTVIRDCLNLIEKNYNIKIDFQNMEYDDSDVYKMIASGNTSGVFQLESQGMTQFMKNLKPTCFEDIVAGISLYRPGPMDSIPKYIENKRNPKKIKYVTPKLSHILDVTYGCLVYQEQVMQIVRDLGGYSYGRSDLVRRAMSKKKVETMLKEKEYFIYGKLKDGASSPGENGENIEIPGCIRNGVSKEAAEAIFDDMVSFALYAFNKSHAAAYGVLAYETAYLKHYYPKEFMAALMTSVMGDANQIPKYIRNCYEMDIEVVPPSVNTGEKNFDVKDGKITFGLKGVKNVGEGVIDEIIRARNEKGVPKDIFTFIDNLDISKINKKAVESLIKAGALREFSENKAALLAVYEELIESAQSQSKKTLEGQISLFEMADNEGITDNFNFKELPNARMLSEKASLAMEKEMLGVYLTSHPLMEYREQLDKIATINCEELHDALKEEEDMVIHDKPRLEDNMTVILCGMVQNIKTLITKKNQMMAFVNLEDLTNTAEVVVFPNVYEASSEILMDDEVVAIKGTLNFKEGEVPKVLANEILDLETALNEGFKTKNYRPKRDKFIPAPPMTEPENDNLPEDEKHNTEVQGNNYVKLKIPMDAPEDLTIEQITIALKRHSGQVPVLIYLHSGRILKTDREMWVEPSSDLEHILVGILGKSNVKI